ncbi:hypothetical protein [Paenibacillus xylanexedens]|uniref:hypothetical protein n=1 Tax=Paenibacillus xylanexedens TaxID=528191 RepID=UPI001C930C24|nr:hypothetical protein [Paenibacillus xylanexedens]
MLDDLGVALMFVNLAILSKHGLNKAADKLINSKNMSALDSNWTAWKQRTKTNLNKTAGNITDVASDTLNRAKNRLPGSKLAMDGSPHVSFSKPTKPLPQNSRQQNFWKETEAGKGDLARKLDGGMGEIPPIKPIESRGEPIKFIPGFKQEEIALKTYEKLRASGLDMKEIEKFAENTDLSLEEAVQLKQHMILTEHINLVDTIDGKYYYKGYFDPVIDVAYGWEEALVRELNEAEKAWFRKLADHELAESKMMKDGLPYRDINEFNGGIKNESTKGAHELSPPQPEGFPGFKPKF